MRRAPWSDEEVKALNRFQGYGFVHPFTCGNDHGTQDDRVLVATKDGWICPGCDYKQTWAYEIMFEPLVNPLDSLQPEKGNDA
jgi:hypothetical protein